MPSPLHDTLNELFRDRPSLAVELIRELDDVELPEGLPVHLGDNNLNDRPSKDLFPDTVVLVGSKHQPLHAIVVEIQQEKSESKRKQLPRYAAALWLFLQCPVSVLIVCPTQKAADEYARPIPTTLPGYMLQSVVVGPNDIPVLTDAEAVIADPQLAVMGIMAHGARRRVVEAFVAGLQKMDAQAAPRYYEYAYRTAAPLARRLLEEIMSSTSWPVYSPFAREHYGRGQEDGRKEGRNEGRTEEAVRMLLLALEVRGIEISDEIRNRITTCTDCEQIETWLRRALTADRADDVFLPEEPSL
ncbi:hypothetical protein [Nocardiopsis rhodophaea]|uniref:hypothetical protein n=1 Tax=Nocardiopsis rhodophaea TaxID=280238 RepID=UPI0031D63622